MKNPINNTVFDSRDVIEYKDYLEQELVDLWNDFLEEYHYDLNSEEEEADDIDGVDLQNDDFANMYPDEIEEYEEVRDFVVELEGYGDFYYGESIIHEDYFEDFVEQMADDIGAVDKNNSSWIVIDWAATADNVKQDYMEVEYKRESYYMRA